MNEVDAYTKGCKLFSQLTEGKIRRERRGDISDVIMDLLS